MINKKYPRLVTARRTIHVLPLWVACVAVAASGTVKAASVERFLVRDGEPAASIVLPDEATPAERFAASELQAYLQKISGASLPILTGPVDGDAPRLWVGRAGPAGTVAEELRARDPEAFAVRTSGGDLILSGGGDRGVIYAVYDFLEQDLGCRWLGPGELWEEIPSHGTIRLPEIDRTDAPGMLYRMLRETSPHGGLSFDPSHPWRVWRAEALRWAVKQRLNVSGLWPGELIEARTWSATGVDMPGGQRGWLAPHTVQLLLPPEKYGRNHPEWYTMRADGVRWPRGVKGYPNLCTSNPEVIAVVADKLSGLFRESPDLDFVSLGAGDDFGLTGCQCPECRALDSGRTWHLERPDYTHRWITFVNAVAERLAETDPGKKLSTIAYNSTTPPPAPGEARPAENVMVQLADSLLIGCRPHGITHPRCAHHEAFRQHLEEWGSVTPAGMLVYLYVPMAAMAQMPYSVPRRFIEDLRYLYGQGVIGAEGQTTPEEFGTYGITKYALAKAMWNPELDADALINDYCRHAFHEAAEPMKRFFDAFEQAMEQAEACNAIDIFDAFTPEVFAAAREAIGEARALATGDVSRERIRHLAVELHCAERIMSARALGEAGMANDDADLLRQAIAEGEAMFRYLAAENRTAPLHIGGHRRFNFVVMRRWRDRLQELDAAQGGIEDQADADIGLRPGDRVLAPNLFSGREARIYRARCEPRVATWIYGAQSPYPAMSAEFEADPNAPGGDWQLILSGQDHDAAEPCPIRIRVNETVLFEGANPFVRFGWSQYAFPLPAAALREQNTLRIENLAEGENVSGPPWFMLNYAVVRPPESE